MRLIGLLGAAGAGKSTVADRLRAAHGYAQESLHAALAAAAL
jgi:adenylate kinase family enzyme